MGFKYIVVRLWSKSDQTIGHELPFIFPDKVTHSTFAASVLSELATEFPDYAAIVVSAGDDLQLTVDHCGGGSTTLNIKARTERECDKTLINGYPYFHGIVDLDNTDPTIDGPIPYPSLPTADKP